MKITIEGNWGDDFPAELRGNRAFFEAMAQDVRKKLGLRAEDIVEVKVIE